MRIVLALGLLCCSPVRAPERPADEPAHAIQLADVVIGTRTVRLLIERPARLCALSARAEVFWSIDAQVRVLAELAGELRGGWTFGRSMTDNDSRAAFDAFGSALRVSQEHLVAIAACAWALQPAPSQPGYWSDAERDARTRDAATVAALLAELPAIEQQYFAQRSRTRAADLAHAERAAFDGELDAALRAFPARCGMTVDRVAGVIVVERASGNTDVFWEKQRGDGSTFLLRCDGSISERTPHGGRMDQRPKLRAAMAADMQAQDAERRARRQASDERACVDECAGTHPTCAGVDRFTVRAHLGTDERAKLRHCEAACDAECRTLTTR